MSGIAVAGLAVGMYGANRQASAIEDAARGQQAGTNLSLSELKRQFDIQQNNLAPWMRAGRMALGEQEALMGLGGDTEASNRALLESPGYKFALEQGNRNLAGSVAARGGMGSGKAMTSALQFGQNYATGQRANRLSELANLSGVGYGAGANLGQAGQNYASNFGNLVTSNANAQGAAGIAGANARQSGVLGGAQLGMNLYDYWNRGRLPSSTPTASPSAVDYNWNPNYSLG